MAKKNDRNAVVAGDGKKSKRKAPDPGTMTK